MVTSRALLSHHPPVLDRLPKIWSIRLAMPSRTPLAVPLGMPLAVPRSRLFLLALVWVPKWVSKAVRLACWPVPR